MTDILKMHRPTISWPIMGKREFTKPEVEKRIGLSSEEDQATATGNT